MRLLLDTHLLIWIASEPRKLSERVINLVSDIENEVLFSVVSIWEIAIKHANGKLDVKASPAMLRRALLQNRYRELPVSGEHALAVGGLPPIHKDPFDRLIIAQSQLESALLLTSDRHVSQYQGAIELV